MLIRGHSARYVSRVLLQREADPSQGLTQKVSCNYDIRVTRWLIFTSLSVIPLITISLDCVYCRERCRSEALEKSHSFNSIARVSLVLNNDKNAGEVNCTLTLF